MGPIPLQETTYATSPSTHVSCRGRGAAATVTIAGTKSSGSVFGANDAIDNNGVHAMDATRWQIPNAPRPNAVISVGGRFLGEVPGRRAARQGPETV